MCCEERGFGCAPLVLILVIKDLAPEGVRGCVGSKTSTRLPGKSDLFTQCTMYSVY
jgi:hypothetical protein